MTDFYSVLRQTLIDRNLRSSAARQDAYTQARTAMIRRLWAFDPPLAEDEIDARIGQFDIAVDRIERDVVAAFAEADAATERARRLPPPPAPAVYDGYDEIADYAASFGGQAVPDHFADDDGSADHDRDDVDDDPFADAIPKAGSRGTTMEERSRLVEAALAEGFDAGEAESGRRALRAPARSRTLPARRDTTPPPAAFEPEADDTPFDTFDDDDEAPAEIPYATDFDDANDAPYSGRPQRYPPERVPATGMPAYDQATGDDADEEEEGEGEGYDGPMPSPRRAVRHRPGRFASRERLLVIAVAALGVILVATSLYVFLPLAFRAPTAVPVSTPATPASPPPVATATPADAIERITLFDGSDPTVFDADSNNPIRFTGGGGSGFTTISTSTSSPGARVAIGSGLSTRLAGEDVRVNIVVRSARERGAASMRFAYQSGLAISHWQSVGLAPDFATTSLVWRVPKMRTNPAGDFILIEPGIPGDGTAADIQSVTIDVLRR